MRMRKTMARKRRIEFPNAFYHVLARGNRKQEIFLEERDYQRFLDYLRDYREKYPFNLYAYALMPNHYHLLIESLEMPLSRVMQALQLRYTVYFNKKYDKVGHLFQGRYKAILCDRDAYLLELVRYIHLNCVRANIVADPLDYPWSSHRAYLDGRQDSLIKRETVLSCFGSRKSAISNYLDFVMRSLQEGRQDRFYQVKDQRFLGEEEFIEKIEQKIGSPQSDVRKSKVTLEAIIKLVCEQTSVEEEVLRLSSRNRKCAQTRYLIGYLARGIGGCRVKDVAEYFNRDPITFSIGMGKIQSRMLEDMQFKQFIETLTERIKL
jgi:REP element-mobilizing transposase RayT